MKMMIMRKERGRQGFECVRARGGGGGWGFAVVFWGN